MKNPRIHRDTGTFDESFIWLLTEDWETPTKAPRDTKEPKALFLRKWLPASCEDTWASGQKQQQQQQQH